jgi:hypothetical protein
LERGDILPLVPFFLVGLGLGLQTAWLEKHHVGASGAAWSLSLAERVLIAGRALWFYAGKLVWPVNLTFDYPRWRLDAAVWWQWLFPAGALAMVAALWFARKRTGRGPLAAVLCFAVTLFPALGFIDVYPFRYSFVADHFQYLACIGPLALAGAGIERGLGRIPGQGALARAIVCAALLQRTHKPVSPQPVKNTHAHHITTLFRGYSTMPWARAALRRGMISRTVFSSITVLTATHSGSLSCEIVGRLRAGRTASTFSRSCRRTFNINPTLPEASIAP